MKLSELIDILKKELEENGDDEITLLETYEDSTTMTITKNTQVFVYYNKSYGYSIEFN